MISHHRTYDIHFVYEGTDIISYLQSKYIIRQRRISYRVSGISLKSVLNYDIMMLRGDGMVEKYIMLYVKRNSILAFICATIVFLPLFVVSLIYDVISYDLVVAFSPYPIALICVLVSLFPTIRFKKMVLQQESLYNTVFSDVGATHLETTLYLSKDWLIWAGSCAIHKEHIRSVKSKVVVGRVGSSNKVTILTADNKHYVIWCLNSSNIKRIRDWYKS